ncbi:hypothetical protein ACFFX1_34960 [Dactylosporangium sucinum]|uniref:Uncharacterized protein n=1 Tax=Dactylosporangium sucinum TaxID=1424081 RepID=A0A917U3G2_9ACTN|nr:hypothetical protein [Dactylosporangium sucinum]GGM50460.1 hypothetical protein GCM10007977_060240 [Dactylosporangium sucinum]
MATQVQEADAELQLEVALALLPLLGRCAEMNGGREVLRRGSRLDDAQDRRALVREVARQWLALGPRDRARYAGDRPAALVEFAGDYVDEVESNEPDEGEYQQYGYDAAMEIVWRRHAESIRRRDAGRE